MQLLSGSTKDVLNKEFKTMIEKKSTNHLVEKVKVGMLNKVIAGVSNTNDINTIKENPNSETESVASDGGVKNPLKAALKHLNKRKSYVEEGAEKDKKKSGLNKELTDYEKFVNALSDQPRHETAKALKIALLSKKKLA